MVTLQDFMQTQIQNHFAQHNYPYQRKVLLRTFHFSGHTINFVFRLKCQYHLVQHNKQENAARVAQYPPGPGCSKGVYSAIHSINLYPVDSAIGFPNTYPLYSDLSGPGCSNIGQGYPPDKSQSRVGKYQENKLRYPVDSDLFNHPV